MIRFFSLRGLAWEQSGWHRPPGIGARSHSPMLTLPLGERSPSGQQPSNRAVSSLPCRSPESALGACMAELRGLSGLLLCARALVKPAQSAEKPFMPAQPVSNDAARPPRQGHRRQSSDILPGGSYDRQGSPSARAPGTEPCFLVRQKAPRPAGRQSHLLTFCVSILKRVMQPFLACFRPSCAACARLARQKGHRRQHSSPAEVSEFR
jgi:hypothetical protein